jgi:cytochrome c
LEDYVERGEILCAKLTPPEKPEAEMQHVKIGLGLVLLAGVVVDTAQAQCTLPAASQIKRVDLITESSKSLNRPDHMAILPDGRVFITEMWTGKVKLFTPGSGVKEVLPLTIYMDNKTGWGTENGLLGIAVDPNFSNTNWVYVFYSRLLKGAGANYSAGDGNISPHEQVLARYTFNGTILTNPKELLIVPRKTARHAAGGLTFNTATGDLYLTTGDDSYPGSDQTKYGGRQDDTTKFWLSSLRTAANTNDLRGKTLRIHPLPFPDSETPILGVGTTYSIPANNLYPVGTAKTRPEVYTMGHRNPFRIKVDPVSGVGMIGEVGPDAASDDASKGSIGHEEFNLVTKAGNYGWPFGVANNLAYTAIAGEPYPAGTKFDMSNLKNTAKGNTGLTDLPPAIGAFASYRKGGGATGVNAPFNENNGGGSTAISGPYYRFNPDFPATKFPAYFNGKFIVGEWSRDRLYSIELDANKALKKAEVFYTTLKAIDIDLGPKGEIYVLEYANDADDAYQGQANTGRLYKLEYSGTQYAATACSQYILPADGTAIVKIGKTRMTGDYRLLNLTLNPHIIVPDNKKIGSLFNLKGERIWHGLVQNGRLILPGDLNQTLAFIKFE